VQSPLHLITRILIPVSLFQNSIPNTIPSSPYYANTNTSNYENNTQTYNIGDFVDTGWESVGALGFKDSNGYYGPYSTAVLIDSEWVLTAAHCLEVEASYYGVTPDTNNTVFYIGGEDASKTNSVGDPSEGSLYGIDQIVIHPNYSNGEGYDLALLNLSTPVSGITPAIINTSSSEYTPGRLIDTVGFDASFTSVKKEQAQTVENVFMDVFTTPPPPADQEFMLGDSGIVAFYGDDPSEVVGIVISTAPFEGHPFYGQAMFTRMDVYWSWIDSVLNP
jgi:secreted trypsin-like serine protease